MSVPLPLIAKFEDGRTVYSETNLIDRVYSVGLMSCLNKIRKTVIYTNSNCINVIERLSDSDGWIWLATRDVWTTSYELCYWGMLRLNKFELGNCPMLESGKSWACADKSGIARIAPLITIPKENCVITKGESKWTIEPKT